MVYHPDQGSAGSPEVFERQHVGTVFNARFRAAKLLAELWLDAERLVIAANGRDVLDTLASGGQLEISTGLFTENDPVDGVWNDSQYEWIARNHRPDHLALLPGKQGACSIRDGCGTVANAAAFPDPLVFPAYET